MNPKDSLREEHGTIMKMLVVLQNYFTKPVDLKEGEAKDLEALIEFFEIYVDRYHHGKEEQHLFPALSRTQAPGIDSLINSLIDDHRHARMNMEQIKSYTVAIHSYTGADHSEFSKGVQRYVELVRKHIRKENSELLPLIEESLSEIEKLRMLGYFHDLEEDILGSSGLEAFLVSVRTLFQKYSLQ
jgi:hemerythrin-like domain-containing protein